jgi:hypothetical protein
MRVARTFVPGSFHHIISRIVDHRWLIGDDHEARTRYLRGVNRAFANSDWAWLSYGVMSNHFHLGAIAGETPPEYWLKRAHSPFGQWLVGRDHGLGQAFAGRPTMLVVGPSDVARVIAYIHNNPVRASVFARAADAPSEWTSHRAYITGASRFDSLDVERGLRLSGFERTPDGRAAFDAWVDERAADMQERLEMERVRRGARHVGPVELGTPVLDGSVTYPIVARPHTWLRITVDPTQIVMIVARTLGLSVRELRRPVPETADARRIAIIAGRARGLSITTVCEALGISVQAGSKLLRDPERLRQTVADLARVEMELDRVGLTELRPSPPKVRRTRRKRARAG